MSSLFGSRKGPDPVEPIDPAEDARERRRRIAARGGFQSTILAGGSPLASRNRNVFKKKLGSKSR